MKCAKCDCDTTAVIDSRESNGGVRRRRACPECKHRFTTYEWPMVNEEALQPMYTAQGYLENLQRLCRELPKVMDELEKYLSGQKGTTYVW